MESFYIILVSLAVFVVIYCLIIIFKMDRDLRKFKEKYEETRKELHETSNAAENAKDELSKRRKKRKKYKSL